MLAEVYRGGVARRAARSARAGGARAGRDGRARALPPAQALRRRAAARRDRPRADGRPQRCCCATSRRATSTRPTRRPCSRCSTSSATQRPDARHRHARGPGRRARPPARPDDRRAADGGARERRPCSREAPEPPRAPDAAARPRRRGGRRACIARPARVALTVLGTVIGVGALVATLGLSKTAGNQIVGRFDALSATDVVVSPSARGGGAGGAVLPWDAEARLRRLNGVRAAGTLAEVDVRGELVRSVPVNDPLGNAAVQLPMKAASPGPVPRRAGAARRGPRCSTRGHSRARRPRARARARTPRCGSASTASTSSRRCSSATGCTRSSACSSGVARQSVAARRGDHARGHGAARVRPRRARPRADRDAPRRRRADRAPGADRAQPERPARCSRSSAPPDPRTLRRGGRVRPQRAVPPARRRVAARRRDRHRQRHARLGARARRRDRPAPRAGRRPPPHRRAVPAREHRHGAGRRHHRRQRRDARHRRRLGRATPGRPCSTRGSRSARRCSARVIGLLSGTYPALRAASLEPVDALRAGT